MSEQVTIYNDNNYAGKAIALTAGMHSAYKEGIVNDAISSVKVPTGWRVTLFEHNKDHGRKLVLTADQASLVGFDNITSNVLVEYLGGNVTFDLPTVEATEATPTLTIGGFLGSVFTTQQPGTVRLWQLVNATDNDCLLTTSDTEKAQLVTAGWTLATNERWVYPATADNKACAGMLPMRHLYNATDKDHRYTTSALESNALLADGWQDKGIAAHLLPLDVTGEGVNPLVRAYKHDVKNSVYSSEPEDVGAWVGQAAAETPTDVGEVTWNVEHVSLDRTFGRNFGPLGEELGKALEPLKIVINSATQKEVVLRPAWADTLQRVYDIPNTAVRAFSSKATVFDAEVSVANPLNPGDTLVAKLTIKLFHRWRKPCYQVKLQLTGNQCLDRFIPNGLSKGKGIPVVGQLGVTDPTFIFSTVADLYDRSLDAGIMEGFNLYGNINLIADDPSKQDKGLKLISDLIGVKSAAIHLGLQIPMLTSGEVKDVPELGFIAELALQWKSWNVLPHHKTPGLNDKHTSPTAVPSGFAMPSIETDDFKLRFSRSDYKVEGKLGTKVELTVGFSTDLALELSANEMLGLEETRLVFTGGADLQVEIGEELAFEPTFYFTMNGTGRNTSGSLTGQKVNTTALTIDRPPLPSFSLKQFALELGVSLTPTPPYIKPNTFGVAATASLEDISGTFAFKADLEDPKEYMLIASVNELSLAQMLLFGSVSLVAFQALPQSWRDKIDSIFDIRAQNMLVYVVPKPTSIAGVHYEYAGTIIAGTLSIYGWKAQAWLLMNPEKGFVINAELDPFELKIADQRVFAIGATGKAPTEQAAALTNYALPANTPARSGLGPRLYCAFLDDDGNGNPSPEFLVDATLELFGAKLAVMASLREGKFFFDTELDLIIFKGALKASFEQETAHGYPRITGSFDFAAGINFGSISTPLGTIQLGKLGFGLTTSVDIGGANPTPSFQWKVSGYLTAPVIGRLDTSFQISVVPGDLGKLGGFIKDEILDGLGDIITNLFHNVEQFGRAIAEGFIDLSTDVVGIMRNTFGAGYDELKLGIQRMGDALGNLGENLEAAVNLIIATAGRFIADLEDFILDAAKSVFNWLGIDISSDEGKRRLEEFAGECAKNPNRFWALQSWNDIIPDDQARWGRLGWNLGNWEGEAANPTSMSRRWSQLNGTERRAAQELAFNAATWDFGFNDPYTAYRAQRNRDPNEYWPNFDWAQLNSVDKANWTVLGWNAARWDAGDANPPPSDNKDWWELAAQERAAAAQLGYDAVKWA